MDADSARGEFSIKPEISSRSAIKNNIPAMPSINSLVSVFSLPVSGITNVHARITAYTAAGMASVPRATPTAPTSTNTNRHTFYYHFKDIPELIQWLYCDEVDSRMKRYDGVLSKKAAAEYLGILKEDRVFYKRAIACAC